MPQVWSKRRFARDSLLFGCNLAAFGLGIRWAIEKGEFGAEFWIGFSFVCLMDSHELTALTNLSGAFEHSLGVSLAGRGFFALEREGVTTFS